VVEPNTIPLPTTANVTTATVRRGSFNARGLVICLLAIPHLLHRYVSSSSVLYEDSSGLTAETLIGASQWGQIG
jgi:hypothetical protein